MSSNNSVSLSDIWQSKNSPQKIKTKLKSTWASKNKKEARVKLCTKDSAILCVEIEIKLLC